METKNICGKIPVELHEKVREELEGTEMTIPQFLQKVIEEHFMKKGVEKMEAKTLAVQVSEELFNRLKERVEKEKRQRRGRFTQKDYLIEIMGRNRIFQWRGKKAGKRKSPCITQGQLLRVFDSSISQIQYIKGSERIQRKF